MPAYALRLRARRKVAARRPVRALIMLRYRLLHVAARLTRGGRRLR
ncbi:hypothetical protein ACNPQM_26090 [Streptomyces sp. NPDC056231]